jgi:hypothetical protein
MVEVLLARVVEGEDYVAVVYLMIITGQDEKEIEEGVERLTILAGDSMR